MDEIALIDFPAFAEVELLLRLELVRFLDRYAGGTSVISVGSMRLSKLP